MGPEHLRALQRLCENRHCPDPQAAAWRIYRYSRDASGADDLFESWQVEAVALLRAFSAAAPNATETDLFASAYELVDHLKDLAEDITAVAEILEFYPRPRHGPDYDLEVLSITTKLAEIYYRLTGNKPGRSSYSAKRRSYGFQRFLTEVFEALGISASAEDQARKAAKWMRKVHGGVS